MYNLELRPSFRNFWHTHSLLDQMTERNFTPDCEIRDEEKFFAISIDVPGIKKEDIDLEVKENHLSVTGERKYLSDKEKDNVVRTERRYGKFSRVFTLPQNVNTEGIEAKFENGVLEIILPKEEKAQARKITISDWKDSSLKN